MKNLHYFLIAILLLGTVSTYAATTPVTVNLKDGSGSPINTGATLKYYDSHGWHTATDNGNGTFTADVEGTNVTYKMYYNNGIETQSTTISSNPFDFQTVTTTLALEDSDGTPLAGGNVKYYQNGWSGNNASNSVVELLPGNYNFKMYYNNGVMDITSESISGTTDEVLFQTVSTTIALEDSDGTPLVGGTAKYYQNGWSGNITPNTVVEMLPGTYNFKMYYNNGVEDKNGVLVAGASDEVLFKTVTTLITLENSNGTALGNSGNAKYYQNGWSSYVSSNSEVELLPGTYNFKMYYNNGVMDINGEDISGSNDAVVFTTVTTSLSLKDSDGNEISGGSAKYYQNGWSGSFASNDEVELLPGTYNFKMYYNNGVADLNGEDIAGSSDEALFTTVTVNPKLVDCDDNELTGGSVKHYQNGWSGSNTPNTEMEMLPGTYNFKMYYNNGIENRNSVSISGNEQDVEFTATKINYVYGGTLKFYQNGWGTYSQGMHLLPGTYIFKFDDYTIPNFVVSGCEIAGNVNIFKTLKHDGSPLPNIPIQRNHIYSSYTNVGTTDANGILFTTDQPNGTWKYKATKDNSRQYIISSPNIITFQTSEFVTNVQHTDGSPFEGIRTQYNHIYSSYMDMDASTTDANGDNSIELFPGDYKFKATKDNSVQYKNLEILTSGTSQSVTFQTSTFVTNVQHTDGSPFEGIRTQYNHIYSSYMDLDNPTTDANGNNSIELFPGEYKFKATKNHSTQYKMLDIPTSGVTNSVTFQTSTFVTNVLKHDGSPFEGIRTQYNHVYSSYMDLDPTTTDANGNASIELFPGEYKFKATKDHSVQYKLLEILTSGVTDVVVFQTALAQAYVRDCDLDAGVEGVRVQYNHVYSSYMDLDPGTTDATGLASIELFPGEHKFKGTIRNTTQYKTVDIVGPVTQFELNPVRVSLNYAGTVKFNEIYSNWTTVGPNTYLFPGTYDFRFYTGNTVDYQTSLNISGCSIDEALIFVQLQNSNGAGLAGGDFDYRYGWGSFTNLGVDATGNGYWAFIDGNPTNAKVKVSYLGASVEKQQNVTVNPVFIFNTVNVTADLKDSQGGLLSADSWEYRYGWGSYSPLNNAGQELLPVNTKVRVGYKGAMVEKQQNVNSNSHYDFATSNVTAELKSSIGSGLTADSWEYRYGWGAYSTLNPLGEELLPVNVKVKVGYKGASVEKQQNVNSNPNYVFTTKNVTAELKSSTGSTLSADDWKYRYGWGAYSSLNNAGEELLPVNVKVKVYYKGACVEKQQNVNSNPNYIFTTKNVTAELKSSTGATLSADNWKYRYGWGAYSSLNNAGEELLPVNVKVKVYYKGACVEQQQNVNTNSHYAFNTVLVTADLKDGGGSTLNADAWDYRYGWGSYSSLNNAGEELLPVNVKVRASYNGKTKEKQQNVGSSAYYLFTWNGTTINKLVGEDSDFYSPEVKVYPNPSEGQFTIDNIKSFEVLSIIDMTGKVVYQINLDDIDSKFIELNNPVSGAYMIKLDGGNSSITTPLIIK